MAQTRVRKPKPELEPPPPIVLRLSPVMKPSDRLSVLQAKMQEYMANAVPLGWLIDPLQRQVYVYRGDAPVEQLVDPRTVSGDPVLPGFTLDLAPIWDD